MDAENVRARKIAGAVDVDEAADGAVVRLHPRLEPAKDQTVARDGHGLARFQTRLADSLVGTRPRDADRKENDGRVHDIAAVTAAVTCDQRRERIDADVVAE